MCYVLLRGIDCADGHGDFSWATLGATVHHHHQITKVSHSINAIGPAPHRGGRKREHRSIVFAILTHIPSLQKIRRNAPRYHPTHPLATPNIIRNKTPLLLLWGVVSGIFALHTMHQFLATCGRSMQVHLCTDVTLSLFVTYISA
jgi:hypothetical protein